MNKSLQVGRWVSGLLLGGALLCFLAQDVVVAQGGPGGGQGKRGGPGGGPGAGGPGIGGPGGGGQGFRGGPGGGGPGGGGPGVFGGGFGGGGLQAGGGEMNCQAMVEKLMTMDANGDGTLAANEVQDPRLHGMMSVADTDANGVVTRNELTTMLTKQLAEQGGAGGGPGGRGFGPNGGGAGERDLGGMRRGPGGMGPDGMGPPQPGELMPMFLQEELGLTEQQRAEVAELQKLVDKKVLGILTKEQRAKYKEMKSRGPGGGGRAGRGPGGPPAE